VALGSSFPSLLLPAGPHSNRPLQPVFPCQARKASDPTAIPYLVTRRRLTKLQPNRIFELQSRTPSSLLTIFFLGPLFFLITPFYFWRSPGHLFFTYIIPIVPFVLAFDGYVSSMRTRSADEVLTLLERNGGLGKGWKVRSGREMHTWPMGYMSWIIAVKGG